MIGSLSAHDRDLLARLRAGDEEAFLALVEQHDAEMLSVASLYEPRPEAARRLVTEAWNLALTELAAAESAPSLRLWALRVLRRLAEDPSGNGHRVRTVASMDADRGVPAVPAERFHRSGSSRGHWRRPPRSWSHSTASGSLEKEKAAVASRAIEALPAPQRAVVELRDVHRLEPAEVCACLEIDEATQRALLHRGRAQVRAALEVFLELTQAPPGGRSADVSQALGAARS